MTRDGSLSRFAKISKEKNKRTILSEKVVKDFRNKFLEQNELIMEKLRYNGSEKVGNELILALR